MFIGPSRPNTNPLGGVGEATGAQGALRRAGEVWEVPGGSTTSCPSPGCEWEPHSSHSDVLAAASSKDLPVTLRTSWGRKD